MDRGIVTREGIQRGRLRISIFRRENLYDARFGRSSKPAQRFRRSGPHRSIRVGETWDQVFGRCLFSKTAQRPARHLADHGQWVLQSHEQRLHIK